MTKKLTFLFLALIIIALACSKQYDTYKPNPDLTFTYIKACGWCAGNYELTIENKNAIYKYNAVCDNEPRYLEKELTTDEINNLDLNSLFEEVKNMELNECGVCYDGCDESLIFEEKGKEYSIQFTNDKDVAQIIDYLSAVRDLFENMKLEKSNN